eukprot:TRINITY_DN1760_c1_g1_i4.p1 TRINITY_DN1760_c1_g1~~TRINITY_DN1760_c1_g1_i4.p1  ORF type:complete len:591 (-),score=103.16 TRINITY_DN1760_c1_g1_i4:1234-3006(-)
MNTFSYQDSLPRLPVPDLDQTCSKYLNTIIPLTTEDEYRRNEALVKDLLQSKQILEAQSRLKQRATSETNSWLETWWNNWAYMDYREPTPINVTYEMQFCDNPNVGQIRRAAILSEGFLCAKEQIEIGRFPPEKVKDTPVDMFSYTVMFNSCRIPHPTRDYTDIYPGSESRDIVVMIDGQFFVFDGFYEDGSVLSIQHFEEQLEKVLKLSKNGKKYPPVGLFTTENRTTWSHIRDNLLKNPTNAESYDVVRKSVLVLCLDDINYSSDDEKAAHFLFGAKTHRHNRFYDKPIQLVFLKNGQCGLVGEHSRMDGQPIGCVNDWVLKREKNSEYVQSSSKQLTDTPRQLEWVLNSPLSRDLTTCIDNFDRLANNTAISRLQFTTFGKEFITKQLKCSPDAIVQTSIQMAYYSLHKRLAAQYESTATRKFKRGRTETTRSLSVPMKKFILAMEDERISLDEKRKLFSDTEKAHVTYAREASNGYGVDRHFLGLRLLADEAGQEQHALFKDPVFSRTGTWVISTSQLDLEHTESIGFGPVVSDGYGICYLIKKDALSFTVTCWNSHKENSVVAFKQNLEKSLCRIRDLMSVKSKL